MNKKYLKARLAIVEGIVTEACMNRDRSMDALRAVAEQEYLEYLLGARTKKQFKAFVGGVSEAAQQEFAQLQTKYGDRP